MFKNSEWLPNSIGSLGLGVAVQANLYGVLKNLSITVFFTYKTIYILDTFSIDKILLIIYIKHLFYILRIHFMALERKELIAVWPLYQEIIDHYNKTIIWQQHAKEVMAKVLSDAYQDFGKKRGPLWVVFFKWPTGVGKSEIVKQTAKLLFGDSHDIVRIDCDQLKQSHEDAVLFGAPPGYIGYNAPAKFSWVNLYASYKLGEKLNTLHKIAKKRKNMAIIVFEEIEKAHPQIIQGLLKMMEEDEVSLKNGETVFLWHSLIVFTSNVWEKASQDAPKSLGFWKSTEEDMKKKLDTKKQYFEKQFSPEFIWRLDHIVEFEPLKTDATQELINKLKEDLIYEVLEVTSSKTTLQIDPNINEFISTKADISKGMRNIEKVWEREIRTNIWTILKINHLDQVRWPPYSWNYRRRRKSKILSFTKSRRMTCNCKSW